MPAIWALLTSKFGLGVVAVIAFFIWLNSHDAKIESRAKAQCQEESLRAALEEVNRQKKAADDALERADEQESRTMAELDALKRQKDKADADNKRDRHHCDPIPDAARKRLRNIK